MSNDIAYNPELSQQDFAALQARCNPTSFDGDGGSQALSDTVDEDDEPFDLDKAQAAIHKACEQLLSGLQDCNRSAASTGDSKSPDAAIDVLVQTVLNAQKIPARQVVTVAITGSQGSGKSSLLNALVGQRIVRTPAGDEAETPFPQIFEWNEGAAEDTTICNVRITLLAEAQIRECIAQHIRDIRAITQFSGDDVEAGDCATSTAGACTPVTQAPSDIKRCWNYLEELSSELITASEFFNAVVGTEDDHELENRFRIASRGDETDAAYGQLLDWVFQMYQTRVHDFRTANSWTLSSDGDLEWSDVDGCEMISMIDTIKAIDPFVERIIISTGSQLLRQGLRLIHLPGSNACSPVRADSVIAYQRAADIEIVVASSEHTAEEAQQGTYLSDAVHQHGPGNTIVVFSEEEDGSRQCSSEARKLSATAQFAGIKRFAVVAGQYENQPTALSTSRPESSEHLLGIKHSDPAHNGISELQNHLARLATTADQRAFMLHTRDKVLEIRNELVRTLSVHRNHPIFETTCHNLANYIPTLLTTLNTLVSTQPSALATAPWTSFAPSQIELRFSIEISRWGAPLISSQTLTKLLRSNGISQRINLNARLLAQYTPHLFSWKTCALISAHTLQTTLSQPVLSLLSTLHAHLNTKPLPLPLARAASSSLTRTRLKITNAACYLHSRLAASIWSIYRRFTTEQRACDPVALFMEQHYRYLTANNAGPRGEGRQDAQCAQLLRRVVSPSALIPHPSLAQHISDAVRSAQVRMWDAEARRFADEAEYAIASLSRELGALVVDGAGLDVLQRERLRWGSAFPGKDGDFIPHDSLSVPIQIQVPCEEDGLVG